MTPNLFSDAKNLFIQALDLPPERRASFLDEQCATRPDLRAEVDRLLEAAAAPDDDGFLSSPFSGGLPLDARLAPEDARHAPGDRIGPYELIDPLGEGGMGVVWRARQSEPIARDVALKVVRVGMDTAALVRRFEAERRTLARLEHPGIARIYDAGATPEGRPYFAMELVEGDPVTTWCDDARASVEQRIRLIISVCDAVHHAHQKGVLHRDLKPSNILVAGEDDHASPRVIDFGIAKAVTGDEAGATMATEVGRPIGTPEYMSPEQAGAGDAAIDTRSDVYSLGVVLFELLTGVRPFDFEARSVSDLARLQRLLSTQDPPRPSTRLSHLPKNIAESAANRRSVDPARLRGCLRGDLDWIVMKAVAREPDRRYASVNELRADLARFLTREPVLARPPSAAYTLSRFAARHRVPVAAGGVAAIAVIVGVIGLIVGYLRIAEERDRAFEAEQTARRQALRAEQTADFLTEMLAGAGPSVALGRDATILREILGQTADRLESLDDAPLVKAELLLTIGQTRADIGDYDEALSATTRAADLLRDAGANEAAILDARRLEAIALHRLGRIDEADRVIRETRARAEELLDPDSPLLGEIVHAEGVVHRDAGRIDEAIDAFRRATAILTSVYGPEDENTLVPRFDLAAAESRLGRFEKAQAEMEEIYSIRRRLLGPKHPLTLFTLNARATMYGSTGRYEEGLPLYEEALELRREVLGPDHPNTANSINNLAYIYARTGRLEEAESMFRRVLDIFQRTVGPDSGDVLRTMNNIGAVLRMQGRLSEAADMLEETYERRRATLGESHPGTLNTLHNIAALKRDLAELDEAARLAERAFAQRVDLLGATHPSTLETLELLNEIDMQRDPPDASAALDRLRNHERRLADAERDERYQPAVDTVDRLRAAISKPNADED